MDAKLVVTSGAKPAKISLRLPTIVGRSADAQLKVKQPNVSRKHCELFVSDGRLKIRDLGSSNGTFVNGTRIDKDWLLASGDELAIGTVRLCVIFQPTAASHLRHRDSSAPPQRVKESRPPTQLPETKIPDLEGVENVHGSAVLNYKDLEDGSFIDIELDQSDPEAVESAIDLDVQTNELSQESRIRLDMENSANAVVDDDSQLRGFLRGLGED
jgi:predicted component of type VI protein secretion system